MIGLQESIACACLALAGQADRAKPHQWDRPVAAQTATQSAPPSSPPPAAPASPISGYMDFHYNEPTGKTPGTLDFHRFVLLFTHRFSDRLRFVSELELEHGFVEGLEEGGELELEQAYLDFLIKPSFNVRAGMLLVPVGIINERHEPPVFHGVERPFVDTVIIPTTWFDVGAGVHGEVGHGVRYRAYLMAPLDATRFSAEEGIRHAAQHGSEAQVKSVAATGRVEYVGTRGLHVGASFWHGNTDFNVPRITTGVGLYEFDGRFSRGRFEARAEHAHVFIDGAGALNDALGRLTGIDPNIARELRGSYVEASYRVLPSTLPHDAAVFLRYENFDTQFKMPAGSIKLPQFDRDAWVVGATYWVDPDVAIKFDYSHVRSRSTVIKPPRSINVGLGWWF
jgi:hypothetical protein